MTQYLSKECNMYLYKSKYFKQLVYIYLYGAGVKKQRAVCKVSERRRKQYIKYLKNTKRIS